MEKINDTWVFTSRTYDYMWLDHTRFAGQAVPLPQYI